LESGWAGLAAGSASRPSSREKALEAEVEEVKAARCRQPARLRLLASVTACGSTNRASAPHRTVSAGALAACYPNSLA